MRSLADIVNELRTYDTEREWFEFKENWFEANQNPQHQWEAIIRIVERKEVPLFDNDAFREAIINAFLHNKWVDGNEPMITVYSDIFVKSQKKKISVIP